MPVRSLVPIFLCFALFSPMISFGQESTGVPFHAPRTTTAQPLPNSGVIQQVSATDATVNAGTNDSKLGQRLASVTPIPELPNKNEQIGRMFDLAPYTKGRVFPSGTNPSQTVVDWIVRQTGTEMWHTAPFGFLAEIGRAHV